MRDLSLEALYDAPASDGQLPVVRGWLDGNWRAFVASPDTLLDEPGPNGCGIYFLWAGDDSLLYVGQSLALSSRVAHHSRYGTAHAASSFLEVPPPFLDHVEYAYIHALKPPANRKFADIAWPLMPEMSARIAEVWAEFCE